MFDRVTYSLEKLDPELWSVIQQENRRQEDHIELILVFLRRETLPFHPNGMR